MATDLECLEVVSQLYSQISAATPGVDIPYEVFDKATDPEVILFLLMKVNDILPVEKYMCCVHAIWEILGQHDLTGIISGTKDFYMINLCLQVMAWLDTNLRTINLFQSQLKRLVSQRNFELLEAFYCEGYSLSTSDFVENLPLGLLDRPIHHTDTGRRCFARIVKNMIERGLVDCESMNSFLEHGLPPNPYSSTPSWTELALRSGNYELAKFLVRSGIRLSRHLGCSLIEPVFKNAINGFLKRLTVEQILEEYGPMMFGILHGESDIGALPKEVVMGHVLPDFVKLVYPRTFQIVKDMVFSKYE